MRITQRDIEVLKFLNRYRYLRRTFIHALLAAPLEQGRLRHRIYALAGAKYLREPDQQSKPPPRAAFLNRFISPSLM
jgi:hypothetical protein